MLNSTKNHKNKQTKQQNNTPPAPQQTTTFPSNENQHIQNNPHTNKHTKQKLTLKPTHKKHTHSQIPITKQRYHQTTKQPQTFNRRNLRPRLVSSTHPHLSTRPYSRTKSFFYTTLMNIDSFMLGN